MNKNKVLKKIEIIPDLSGSDAGKGLVIDDTGTLKVAEPVDIPRFTAVIPVSGWSAAANADGWYTNQVAIAGMREAYNPFATVVISSAELAQDEMAAMGSIIKIETYDDYVIAKALEPTEIDITVRFIGSN